jgi:phosphohistidine phosphatase
MAAHLARLGIEPELVLCSPARRTRETLELVRPGLGAAKTVRLEDALYGASPDELLEHLRTVPETVASVMLIGHNPGLQDLALTLASSGPELDRLEEKFPTAALATLELVRTPWARLAQAGATLSGYVVPKQLD